MERPSPLVERLALTVAFTLGIGLLILAALIADSGSPDTSASGDIVERREPLGEEGFSQLPILIDLAADWGVSEMTLNGVSIPENEWDVTPELALYRFTPGDGKTVTEFLPGRNEVEMVIFELLDPTNTRIISWEFQIF